MNSLYITLKINDNYGVANSIMAVATRVALQNGRKGDQDSISKKPEGSLRADDSISLEKLKRE